MAEEEIGAAGGAKVADENVLGAKARGQELRAVGFAEIEMDVFGRRLVAGGLHVEPLERVGLFAGAGFVEIVGGIGELRGEFGDEVGGDFVAARADGGAERRREDPRACCRIRIACGRRLFARRGRGCRAIRRGWRRRRVFSASTRRMGTQSAVWMARRMPGAIGGGGVAFARIGGGLREMVEHVGMDLL